MTAETHLQGVEISAAQFFEIWHHYDSDGNGFMDGKELQNFIQELQQARKKAGLDLTPEMKAFVDQYGKSTDGKIGIVELAQVLPTEENFLLFFRCQQLKSSEDFMQTWRKYDSDHSGFIDSEELKVVRNLWRSSGPNSLLKQYHPEPVAQDLVQMAFARRQEWRLYSLRGQPVPVLCHPCSENVFPDAQREHLVFHFVTIVSGAVSSLAPSSYHPPLKYLYT